MKRDLSEEQFRNAAKKEGFAPSAFGYWNLAKPHDNVSVYRFNAGDRRRDQLAYLRAQQKQHARELVPSALDADEALNRNKVERADATAAYNQAMLNTLMRDSI